MRYGKPHSTERIGAKTIFQTLRHVGEKLEDARIVGASGHVSRSTKIAWIKDKKILSTYLYLGVSLICFLYLVALTLRDLE